LTIFSPRKVASERLTNRDGKIRSHFVASVEEADAHASSSGGTPSFSDAESSLGTAKPASPG
jgi:hypothetical protein